MDITKYTGQELTSEHSQNIWFVTRPQWYCLQTTAELEFQEYYRGQEPLFTASDRVNTD